MKPGATAFTVIPLEATSLAMALVNPIMPALVAAYSDWPALPICPTTDDRLMILPYRWRIMIRDADLVQKTVPLRLVPTTWSQSPDLIRIKRLSEVTPALLTRISIFL